MLLLVAAYEITKALPLRNLHVRSQFLPLDSGLLQLGLASYPGHNEALHGGLDSRDDRKPSYSVQTP
jgi:hypothetical protein